MSFFLAGAAALVMLVIGYVTRPLWRGQRAVAAVLALTLATCSALLYSLVGTPDALDPARRHSPATLDDAISQLEAELRARPGEAEGWRLLARAYAAAGRTVPARDAFGRAAALSPTPDVLAEAAEARALASADRRFDEAAVALLRDALRREPAHQRARWFLGIAQRQAGQPGDAARTWEPLLSQVDARTAASLRPQVDAARKAAGLAPLATPAPASAALAVNIDVAPALRAQLREGATLYVIARQPGGPPMPVAVKRVPARLPASVTLSDADSPMPTLRLSQLTNVELQARVSFSGEAAARPGDLESPALRVQLPAASPVRLQLSQRVQP